MKEYICTREDWDRADERARKQPVFSNSHRKKEGNFVGCLGEVIAERWLNEEGIAFADETHCTTHDYRLRNGKTIDVKTKDRTVPPRSNYDCSVPLYNHDHQRPDYYIFVSLKRKSSNSNVIKPEHYTSAFVLGALGQNQLEQLGVQWDGGETDETNGTTFWTSCLNVRIDQLVSIDDAAKAWRRVSPA